MFWKCVSQIELRYVISKKAASISQTNLFAIYNKYIASSFSQDATKQSDTNLNQEEKILQPSEFSENSFQMPNPPINKQHMVVQQVEDSSVKLNKGISNEKDIKEILADAATPLWRIPYAEQLRIKDQRSFDLLKKLTSKLKKDSPSNQIHCQLLPTVPSVYNF